jgi:hypothetical protein
VEIREGELFFRLFHEIHPMSYRPTST